MAAISVIICTHNPREEHLRRTLEGLRAQTLPMSQWELLLIDNRSDRLLADHFNLTWHPQARHVREEELGLTPARLRGIQESVGATIVFVDDDNVLDPNYLEQALAVGNEWPFVGAWGGSLVPEAGLEFPNWAANDLWRIALATVAEDVWSNLREGFTTIPAGAGMCIRRSVGRRFLEWCGSRKQSKKLDRTGTTLAGYGDADLAHCALDLGLGCGKSARLRLTHLVPPSRLTLDYFVRHAEADAASLLMFRAIRGLPISPPDVTLVSRIRQWIHWTFSRSSPELCRIQEAHQLGTVRGWKAAADYLQQSASPFLAGHQVTKNDHRNEQIP